MRLLQKSNIRFLNIKVKSDIAIVVLIMCLLQRIVSIVSFHRLCVLTSCNGSTNRLAILPECKGCVYLLHRLSTWLIITCFVIPNNVPLNPIILLATSCLNANLWSTYPPGCHVLPCMIGALSRICSSMVSFNGEIM